MASTSDPPIAQLLHPSDLLCPVLTATQGQGTPLGREQAAAAQTGAGTGACSCSGTFTGAGAMAAEDHIGRG